MQKLRNEAENGYLGGFITHLFQFECVFSSLSVRHTEVDKFLSVSRLCHRQLECDMEILEV